MGDLCVVVIVYIIASARSQDTGVCPVIGTDLPTSLSRSTEERIFLNFEAPSQCRGNVTSWTYCHYDSQSNDDDCEEDDDDEPPCRYGAKFIVYRRHSPTSNIYEPVAGSVTEKILLHNDVPNFRCRTETLARRFEIRENDVISACVWDDGPINPLYLVGDSFSTNQNLYQYDRSGYDDCRTSQIGSVNTTRSDFRQRARYRLHLYVNIGALVHDDTVSCSLKQFLLQMLLPSVQQGTTLLPLFPQQAV